jgi:hypothetical protein
MVESGRRRIGKQQRAAPRHADCWQRASIFHVNAAGGCQSSQDGVTITTWEYSPVTAAIVKQACPPPGLFVSP